MKRKVYTLFIMLLAVFSFFPAVASANSAEPPALIVILKNAPEDVSVSIISADSMEEGKKARPPGKRTMLSTKEILETTKKLHLGYRGTA